MKTNRRTTPDRWVVGLIRAVGWFCIVPGAALAQPGSIAAPGAAESAGEQVGATARGNEAVEAYLDTLGLTDLRAEFLLASVAKSPRDQRVPIAEKLAKVYVELLGKARTPDERSAIEGRAGELLKMVPEADGYELRINLAKAIYLRAEEGVERQRMRLATPDESAQAQSSLKSLDPQFRDIAARLHQRVEQLERKEQTGDDSEELTSELSEARRLRSLAFYYAGWCEYYLAYSTSTDQPALEALKSFGWLLNSPNGRAASVDKITTDLLKYEHIARAAIGCALAAGERNNDVEAIRWLDAVEHADDAPQAVRDQLLSRRMIVLARAKRWADLERLVRRTRNSDRSGTGPNVTPLTLWNARLLAVLTLESDRRLQGDVVESLGRIALADLVARGEVWHVLDLVDKFGTTPIGETGFIVHYVRGIQAYERARDEHKKSGKEDADEPTGVASVANAYRSAADLLQAAIDQADAEQFAVDRARAALALGRARFFAGEMREAAAAFRRAFEMFGPPSRQGGTAASKAGGAGAEASGGGEEALWLTILALDRAVKGQGNSLVGADRTTQDERNQTVALFLQTYPDSDRAGRLLLMQISAGLLSNDEAIRVLGGVATDSPMYPAARRQLAKMLYDRLRAARGAEREVAALKFLQVADDAITTDRRTVTEGATSEERRGAAERVIVIGRQMLDALLGVGAPDATRAQSILETIEAVAEHQQINLAPNAAELAYRRVQIKLAAGDDAGAGEAARALAEMGKDAGEFGEATDRLLFRRASSRWRANMQEQPGSPSIELARGVVGAGVRLIDRFGDSPETLKEPGVLGAVSTVAGAAFATWKATGEVAMRDLSLGLDERVLGAQPNTLESLVRVCETAENAGKPTRAIECWGIRLGASSTGTDGWFEAKYNVIRLFVKIDAAKARAQLRQHQALYPDFGPEPWGPRLRDLNTQLGPDPASVEPTDAGEREGAGGGG